MEGISGTDDGSRGTDIDITPKVTQKQATDLALKLYGLSVTHIKQLNGYDDKNYHIKVSEHHSHPSLDKVCELGYVLKIINTEESKLPLAVDMQIQAMHRLNAHGITAPNPVKNIHGDFFSAEEIYTLDDEGNKISDKPITHLIRMSTYIPGVILYEHPSPSLDLFCDVGRLVAKVNKALRDLENHAIFSDHRHGTLWHMKNHHWLKDYIYATRDAKRREMLMEVVLAFQEKVLIKTDSLTQGIIHNDINEQNILIQRRDNPSAEEHYHICGLLDFGDINKSCSIFDVAITMMYMMTVAKNDNFLQIGAAVLRGYRELVQVSDADLDVLPYAVAMRYAISLGMGEHGVSLNPDNTYLLTTAEKGWGQLEKIWTMSWDQLRTEWRL